MFRSEGGYMNFLTAKEAADRWRMDKKTFLKLRLQVYCVSARKFLYTEEILDAYTWSRLQCDDPAAGEKRPQRQRKARILQRGVTKVLTPREILNLAP